MIKKKEQQLYQQLAEQLEETDGAMGREALDGFFHALALTPRKMAPGEWLAYLFGGRLPAIPGSSEATEESLAALVRIYQRYCRARRAGRLRFSLPVEDLNEKRFAAIVDWTSGFCYGLLLAPETWFPQEEAEELPQDVDDSIDSPLAAFSLMQALIFPDEFVEADEFQAMCGEDNPREVMEEIMTFAVENLPVFVDLFHRHAAGLEAGAGTAAASSRLHLVGDAREGAGEAAETPGEAVAGRVVSLDDFRRSNK